MPNNPSAPPEGPAAAAASPTNVRFLVIGMCIAMSLLLYLDRFAITPATDTMLRELKLSKGQFGEAVGAFFLAYALMQIPSGWLTDVLGARWMLALYVVGWSLATIGLGLADGLTAIWGMRLILGVTQAGAYPAAAGLLKRWVPYNSRGLANSSVAMGGRSGLLVSLALTVPAMFLVGRLLGWQTDQWRVVFVVYGALGLAWAATFSWMYRDSPRQHPWANRAEAELIARDKLGGDNAGESPAAKETVGAAGICCVLLFAASIGWILLVSRLAGLLTAQYGAAIVRLVGSEANASAVITAAPLLTGLVGILLLAAATNRLLRRVSPATGNRLALPLAEMLASKEVWLMCGINFCVNVGWIFLATWLPQYLVEVHGEYVTKNLGNRDLIAGWMTAVTGLAAMCGGLSGGRATDLLVRRFGPVWGRRLPGMCAGLLVCGMYLVVPQLPGLWLFLAAMIAIAFTIDFGLGATWASYQDIGGRHVASVLGCGNMCGNLGAAYFGGLIGYLADENRWNTVFLLSAGAMALASCGWLFFDASRPISDE
ncbi:MAG: MFS transporter [Pirellulaceae bacterium]